MKKQDRFYIILTLIFGFVFAVAGIYSLFFWSKGDFLRQIIWGLIGFVFGIFTYRYWRKFWRVWEHKDDMKFRQNFKKKRIKKRKRKKKIVKRRGIIKGI